MSTKVFVISHLTILILSLVFLGGLYFVLNSDEIFSSSLKNYLPVTKKPVSLYLNLNSPDDEVLVFDKSLLVSGTTTPKSVVIISLEKSDAGTEANNKGDFSKIIELSEGLNLITVTSFDSEGNSKQVSRTIFYLEEKI